MFFFAVTCNYFNWRLYDFLRDDVSLNYTCFRNCWTSKLPSSELSNASSLSEVFIVRDNLLFLDNFNRDEVDPICNGHLLAFPLFLVQIRIRINVSH